MLNKKKVSRLNRNGRIKTLEEAKKELENLEELQKNDPAAAKIVAKAALIRTGVLNEDGSSKEHIVTESLIGYEENNMSYESIVDTMKKCMKGLRDLGDGDYEKTRSLIKDSLMDSGFVTKDGHLIVREKRAPHVEAFFKRVEDEMKASGKQRVRK